MKTPINHTAQSLRSFYRPHPRVQTTNEVIDYKTGEIVSPPSRTEQHHRDACDINLIVKRMKPQEMAQLIQANSALGMYTDLPDNTDYQSAIDTVMQAEQSFNSLPSKVRERFGHDPALFLAFATNPSNLDDLRSMGLAATSLPPPVPPAPQTTQPPTPQAPPTPTTQPAPTPPPQNAT